MLAWQNDLRPKIRLDNSPSGNSEMLVALILMHALTLRPQSHHSSKRNRRRSAFVSLFSENQKL
jgi:hypothetical protein